MNDSDSPSDIVEYIESSGDCSENSSSNLKIANKKRRNSTSDSESDTSSDDGSSDDGDEKRSSGTAKLINERFCESTSRSSTTIDLSDTEKQFHLRIRLFEKGQVGKQHLSLIISSQRFWKKMVAIQFFFRQNSLIILL